MASSLAGIKSIEEFELEGKRVFLRLDLNVPIKNGVIADMTRIEAALPTIQYAMDRGARLVIGSHLGRPEKSENPTEFSLEPIAKKLGELLDAEVLLVEDPEGDAPKELLKTLRAKEILLLENLRFSKDESTNGEKLARKIAAYTEIYINDAFGASHRAHASIVGVPTLVKQKGIGFLMKKELEMLDKIHLTPEKPFTVILGGAKVSDKMGVIEKLIDKVDVMCIGGAMAYTFLEAQGVPVGKSRIEKDKIKYAKELMERMKAREMEFLLPLDHHIVNSLTDTKSIMATPTPAIGKEFLGIDIGPKTVALFSDRISKSRTIFWNGPMGIFETPDYSRGTFAIAKAIAASGSVSIIGGGDSAAAVNASGYADKVTHISTGGGASLEYLQGDVLPGIKILKATK
jgi:phosphoglycerate kinase